MPIVEGSAPHRPDSRYLFWAQSTAAQAHLCGRRRGRINRRVEAFFRDMCLLVDPTLSLELGAHEAEFSSWVKASFPGARCVAFEANPYVVEEHAERLAAEGVEYHPLAVAATNGTVTITIPRQIGEREVRRASRMASLAVHRESGDNETVDVEAVRVDDFVRVAPDDRLVAWIDVEGASGEVLLGSTHVLARASAIYIEVERVGMWHDQWLDVDVARHLDTLGKIPVVRDIQRDRQYNVVFLDHELAARAEVAERAARVLTPPRRRPRP
jgi:FkbM family methyltransferase